MRIKLGEVDAITLDIGGTVIERLDADAGLAASADDSAEEEDDSALPLTIAVDVNDAPAEGVAASTEPAAP